MMTASTHDIQGGTCVRCGMSEGTTKLKDLARAGCPGVRWIKVGDLSAETHLATVTQLRGMHQKLAPGQQPAACYWSGSTRAYRMLYRMDEAVPIRKQTERQREATEDALRAARAALTCTWCRLRVRRKSALQVIPDGGHLCADCVRRWHIGMEAQAILRAPERFCILDTETMGLDPAVDEIVEVAVIGLDGSVLLNTLVHPEQPIPLTASYIHGISNEDVATAPTFAEVLPQLTAAVAGRSVLAYNVSFDLGMIRAACERLGVRSPVRRKNSLCLMEWYAEWVGDWSDSHEGYTYIPLDGGHRALGDCHAALARLHEMAEAIPRYAPDA